MTDRSVVAFSSAGAGGAHLGDLRRDTPMAVVTSVAVSEHTMPPGGPAELDGIILRALDRDPEERFASVQELRLAVRATMVLVVNLGLLWRRVSKE